MRVLIIILFSFKLFAATQGGVGNNSTGTSDITIILGELVQISDIDDINPAQWGGSGDIIEFDEVCVFANNAGGAYRVIAEGSGSGSAFEVSNGVNNVSYNLYWSDQIGLVGDILTPSAALTGQSNADQTDNDCNNGANLNARFTVEFLEASLLAAPVSIYSGTVTFTIEPE